MSDQQQLDSVNSAAASAPASNETAAVSAGGQLRAAREAAGLHVAALAVAMKVPVKKLEALEADRWDLLPDVVFIRALASAVCRTLKMDAAPVLQQLPQVATPRLDTEERGINTPFRSAERASQFPVADWLRRPTVVTVLVLLAGAVALWLVPEIHFPKAEVSAAASAPLAPVANGAVSPAGVASAEVIPGPADAAPVAVQAATPVTAPVPVASGSLPQVAAPKLVPAPTPGTQASSPVATPAATAPTKPASVATVSAPAPAAHPGTGIVVFKAKEPTWVEVVDARKTILVRRTLAAGETVGYTGELPLAVVVGRIEGVAVEVRGQPVNPEPLTGTNVARFEVK